MVYAIGISAYSVSLYHLINHAFFKALLFLSAGSLIHALSDEQDLRRMGALRKILAFTYVNMLIGSISLMGIPYCSGFYSKEVILGLGYSSPNLAAGIGYWLCLISALFTTIYSIRLLTTGFLVIGNENRPNLLKQSHEPDLLMTVCLGILALASVCVGYGLSDIFSMSSDLFQDSLFVLPQNLTNTHLGGSLYPLGATLIGALAAFALNIWFPGVNLKLKMSVLGSKLYKLLITRYLFDAFYSALTKITLKLGWLTAKELDKGLGEFLGPTGLYYLLHKNPKTEFSLTEISGKADQLTSLLTATTAKTTTTTFPASPTGLANHSFNAPHFLISKSPIVYGQYIILSLFLTLTLVSLIVLYG
jgi:NADH-ubiquinone oxidoreductase chain 5